MFFRWWGGCGSKQPGLMNMLEAPEHARVHFQSDCAKLAYTILVDIPE